VPIRRLESQVASARHLEPATIRCSNCCDEVSVAIGIAQNGSQAAYRRKDPTAPTESRATLNLRRRYLKGKDFLKKPCDRIASSSRSD
jgi:hypothetical protein